MKYPGHPMNVPCDWCRQPSHFAVTKKIPYTLYSYACEDHMDRIKELNHKFSTERHDYYNGE